MPWMPCGRHTPRAPSSTTPNDKQATEDLEAAAAALLVGLMNAASGADPAAGEPFVDPTGRAIALRFFAVTATSPEPDDDGHLADRLSAACQLTPEEALSFLGDKTFPEVLGPLLLSLRKLQPESSMRQEYVDAVKAALDEFKSSRWWCVFDTSPPCFLGCYL